MAKKAAKGKDGTAQEAAVASGVANLKVNDIPPPKSKGLDVVKEFENSNAKRSVSFVVVGK
jgi:elongation factor 1 alpha-like protein